jgi:hypothetical protein
MDRFLFAPFYLATHTERWACFLEGPLVSEIATWTCVGIPLNSNVRWLTLWFCMPARGNIDISHLISSFPHELVRVWRSAMRRRVRSVQRQRRHGQRAPYMRLWPLTSEPCPFLFLSSLFSHLSRFGVAADGFLGFRGGGARWGSR